jgi:hypothetical protein
MDFAKERSSDEHAFKNKKNKKNKNNKSMKNKKNITLFL